MRMLRKEGWWWRSWETKRGRRWQRELSRLKVAWKSKSDHRLASKEAALGQIYFSLKEFVYLLLLQFLSMNLSMTMMMKVITLTQFGFYTQILDLIESNRRAKVLIHLGWWIFFLYHSRGLYTLTMSWNQIKIFFFYFFSLFLLLFLSLAFASFFFIKGKRFELTSDHRMCELSVCIYRMSKNDDEDRLGAAGE